MPGPKSAPAVRPDLVDRDEQVRVVRPATVLLEVAELDALAREVVHHQVKDQVVVGRERAQVRPGPEPRLDLTVGHRREAAVTR